MKLEKTEVQKPAENIVGLSQESSARNKQMQNDAELISERLNKLGKAAQTDKKKFLDSTIEDSAHDLIAFELGYGKKFEPIPSNIKLAAYDALVQIQDEHAIIEGGPITKYNVVASLTILSDRRLRTKDRYLMAALTEDFHKELNARQKDRPIAGTQISEGEKRENLSYLIECFGRSFLGGCVLATRASLGSIPASFKSMLNEYDTLCKRSEFSEKDALRVIALQQSIMKATLKAVSPVR